MPVAGTLQRTYMTFWKSLNQPETQPIQSIQSGLDQMFYENKNIRLAQ